ncbi:MAG: hypothetical protein ACHQ7N_18445 [Candidatus Methylomirabilales bacterium]
MHMLEDMMLLIARERMEDALRSAEWRRALRLARGPRRPARVLLGMALIRLGHWLLGQPSSAPGTPIALRQAQS